MRKLASVVFVIAFAVALGGCSGMTGADPAQSGLLSQGAGSGGGGGGGGSGY